MRILTISTLAAAFAFGLLSSRADAMPPFAQAYGEQCNVCHTQVPALNAYGRYVQRTGYASLDPHVLRRANPVWVGENTWYDSQDPAQPHHVQFGNVALHATGTIGDDWTYHAQSWVRQNNTAGDLDTMWIAYNNLFHRDGHLFVGYVTSPGPSPWSQWVDLSGFATPELAVGEHAYQTDGNRWGAKLAYVHASTDAEVAWLGSSLGWTGPGDFQNDTDKTVQWKLAHADPQQPLEYGAYGSIGSFPLAEGPVDTYKSYGLYVQRDPVGYAPGVLAMYQMNYDSNPDDSFNPVGSNAATLELYEPVFNRQQDSPSGQGLIALRKEFTNDGMGTVAQSGNIDFSYHVARYLHFFGEVGIAQNSTPAFRYMFWWTMPIQREPQ
jgi:hypothetical protein